MDEAGEGIAHCMNYGLQACSESGKKDFRSGEGGETDEGHSAKDDDQGRSHFDARHEGTQERGELGARRRHRQEVEMHLIVRERQASLRIEFEIFSGCHDRGTIPAVTRSTSNKLRMERL